jgi:CRP-like cAMP-binding protein
MDDNSINYLKSVIPFSKLPESSLQSISQDLKKVNYPAGKIIIEAGEEGDSLYIIEEGSVQIYIKESGSGDKIILSQLSRGDYFGEMALITGEPRSATVEALENVDLYRLDKKGFDKLINENPSISLYLSHMLSQRLKNANIKRVESEKLYHEKIAPSGNLSDTPFYEVLKFCEQNSLTGEVKLENKDAHAEISFLKGNVQNVVLGKLSEAEAIDVMMQWKEGTFVIEPALFSIDEEITLKSEEPHKPEDMRSFITVLFNSVLKKLVSIVGSQTASDIIEDTAKQLEPFFPNLRSCHFEIMPEIRSDLKFEDEWGDKETLALAVFLQSLVKNCRPLVFGMDFIDMRELSGEKRAQLEKISFFDYMEHANEFVI